MSLKLRRVVTGHDASGRATVKIDELVQNAAETRAGVEASVVWTTQGFPVDNDDPADGSTRKVGTSEHDGTVFRVVCLQPGAAPRIHRTDSVDYAVVISGEIYMELDDGVGVTLRQGDVLVQRGTIHNWFNRGTVPCTIAFVLVGARPARPGGKALPAVG
ncbi:MAG: cupin domain protein [Betaproteobacteria bacterium]|nr:cupin domain protein [Betaproteobacteria bacterium]